MTRWRDIATFIVTAAAVVASIATSCHGPVLVDGAQLVMAFDGIDGAKRQQAVSFAVHLNHAAVATARPARVSFNISVCTLESDAPDAPCTSPDEMDAGPDVAASAPVAHAELSRVDAGVPQIFEIDPRDGGYAHLDILAQGADEELLLEVAVDDSVVRPLRLGVFASAMVYYGDAAPAAGAAVVVTAISDEENPLGAP